MQEVGAIQHIPGLGMGGRARGYGTKYLQWNQDRGFEGGVNALNRAREAFGKNGEGIREFSKLVLQFVDGNEGTDAAELIQKEMAEENARIIRQLLNGEI